MTLDVFARHSVVGRTARGYSGERCKNMFFRPVDSGGILAGRAGGVEVYAVPGRVRQLVSHAGAIYAAAAGGLYNITTSTRIGDLPDGDTVMVSSGSEIAITVNGGLYVYDGSLQSVWTPLNSLVGITYMSGYFIAAGSYGGRDDAIAVSTPDQPTEWDALDFAFAESRGDSLVAITADHDELWLIGGTSTEVWQLSGSSIFPFERGQGGMIERGCQTATTVDREDNAVFLVGPQNAVYRIGQEPQVISTREVEEQIAKHGVEAGFTFTDRGEKMYGLRLTGAPSLTYSMATGLWHERTSGLYEDPWHATCSAWLDKIQYFGTADGRIVVTSEDDWTDAGTPIVAEAATPPIVQGGDHFSIPRVKIHMTQGLTDIGRQPRIILQQSDDGHTWGREQWEPLNSIGNYDVWADWSGMGAWTSGRIRLRITDNINRDVHGVTFG